MIEMTIEKLIERLEEHRGDLHAVLDEIKWKAETEANVI